MKLIANAAVAAAAIVTALLSLAAFAQGAGDYPGKPVRVILPSATGGGIDIQGRLYSAKMSELMKRQFVVENRPGGGSTIGYAALAKAPPDGYTLGSLGVALSYAQDIVPDLSFDPLKAFAPIALLSKTPYLMTINNSVPAKNLKEFVAYAKASPGKLNWGASRGAFTHLAAVYIIKETGIDVTMVPYKGGDQVVMGIMAGELQAHVGSILSNLPHVRSGKMRALAITTPERSPMLPDVQTMTEAGVPTDISSWNGWAAPAGTPALVINRLNGELLKVVRLPEVIKVMEEDGGVMVGSTPQQFQQLIAAETARWRKVINDTGFKLE